MPIAMFIAGRGEISHHPAAFNRTYIYCSGVYCYPTMIILVQQIEGDSNFISFLYNLMLAEAFDAINSITGLVNYYLAVLRQLPPTLQKLCCGYLVVIGNNYHHQFAHLIQVSVTETRVYAYVLRPS